MGTLNHTPSRLRLIREAETLVRVIPTLDLRCEENVVWWRWNSPLVDFTN
jgi:hypothetical protein